jgi:hypothetical protein
MADAVITELGEIPDREFDDPWGQHWEWCGGVTGTWAWRITRLEVRRLVTLLPAECSGTAAGFGGSCSVSTGETCVGTGRINPGKQTATARKLSDN